MSQVAKVVTLKTSNFFFLDAMPKYHTSFCVYVFCQKGVWKKM